MSEPTVIGSLDGLRRAVRDAAREADDLGLLPLKEVPYYERLPEGGHQYGVREEADWDEFSRTLMNSLQHGPELHAAMNAVSGPLEEGWGEAAFDRLTRTLEIFAAEYLRRTGIDQVNDVTAFKSASERLISFLEARSFSWTMVTPIPGLELAGAPLPPSSGASWSPLTEETKTEFWRAHGPVPAVSQTANWNVHDFIDCQAALEYVVATEAGSIPNWVPAQDTERDVLMALRVHGGRGIRGLFGWFRPPAQHEPYLAQFGGAGLLTPLPLVLGRSWPYMLDEGRGEALRAWLSKYHAATPRPASVNLALRRLNDADLRMTDADRLVDCWVALEALFLPERMELKYRASLRIASFLGRDSEDRKAIKRRVGASYDLRSAVVHGDPLDSEAKVRALRDTAQWTEETLRAALKRWPLRDSPKQVISRLDDSLLE